MAPCADAVHVLGAERGSPDLVRIVAPSVSVAGAVVLALVVGLLLVHLYAQRSSPVMGQGEAPGVGPETTLVITDVEVRCWMWMWMWGGREGGWSGKEVRGGRGWDGDLLTD